MLDQYIKEDLIFLNETAKDRQELFRKMADIFEEKGYVTAGFHDFLANREDNFPTGLEMEHHNVAIPHGDPEFIKESFIAVVTLQEPIKMAKMEDPDEFIDVDTFFILGLGDGGQHLDILRAVIGVLQEDDFVNNVKAAKSPAEVVDVITAATAK